MGGLLHHHVQVSNSSLPYSPIRLLIWVFFRILALVQVHSPTMPLHIACMYHLPHLHSKLFMLAHEMVDREPENPVSWYAVGVWYLASNKWSQARQYFRCACSLLTFGVDTD